MSLNKNPSNLLAEVKKNKITISSPLALRKKHFYLLTILLTLLTISTPALCKNELALNLEREFNRIATSFPENWEKYFSRLDSIGQIKVDKFHVNDTEHRLKKVHRFIDEIVTKFLSIVYADYVVFKTFSFSVSSYYSEYQEFVGAARIINNWVEVAYMQISTKTQLIPQFDYYNGRSCRKVFFLFEKCENYTERIPRGYTMNELQLLLYTMKAHSYMHLLRTTKNVLAALQSKEFVLSMNSPYFSEDGAFFLLMQHDGNLVVYQREVPWGDLNDKPVWASETFHYGQEPYLLVIETDGELVIYDSFWVPLWKAGTAGKGVAPRMLKVTNDGDLQLVDERNEVLWKTEKKQ